MRSLLQKLFKREAQPVPVRAPDAGLAQDLLEQGIAAEDAGENERALGYFQRAIEADPTSAAAHMNLGIALQTKGEFAAAIESCSRAVALEPGSAPAHYNLGLAHLAGAKLSEAESAFRAALVLREAFPEAWVALAEALESAGRDAEALAALQRAIVLRENYEGALRNAGALLQKMGRLRDAGQTYFELATFLQNLGRLAEAEVLYRRAIELKPDFAKASNSLATAIALQDPARIAEAEALYRQAIALDPEYALPHNNLGNILQGAGRLSESEASLRRALELKPDLRQAHVALGNALKDLGRLDEAESSFRRALELDPDDRYARDSLLMALNYTARHSRAQVFAEHIEWARRHESPHAAGRRAHLNVRDPHRRLRIAYVSPDFRRHSVAYFIEPVLAQHDRRQFEVYCYSNVAVPDSVTVRLMKLADRTRSMVGVSEADAAELVRADGIDILVDLAGHTAGHALGVLARKPAPVQVTYLGYPNTTGLGAVDWRITDVHADPPGDGDGFHSERLARLAHSFLCFQPPQEAPEVRPSPFVANGYVTFGSFNVLPKVTPEVISTWARLLERVPRSRLLLKALGLRDGPVQAHILAQFAKHGIDAARIALLPMEHTLLAHLERYHDMDIALDPFPFNGTTTTLEALWMGVPVVAIAGDRHSARVGASILANAGLEKLLAGTVEQYVALAAGLACDPERLTSLRRAMRGCVAASPLRDQAGMVTALEDAYRGMWAQWCADPCAVHV